MYVDKFLFFPTPVCDDRVQTYSVEYLQFLSKHLSIRAYIKCICSRYLGKLKHVFEF